MINGFERYYASPADNPDETRTKSAKQTQFVRNALIINEHARPELGCRAARLLPIRYNPIEWMSTTS